MLVVSGGYALVRVKRAQLDDFAVYYNAATRFLASEPLYRSDDKHYQFKYLPAFALIMAPFTFAPKQVAEIVWFALTVAFAWTFFHLSLNALPDRRLAAQWLIGLTLLLVAKFLVIELVLGQINLLVGLLMLCAIVASRDGRPFAAGAAVAAAVFVKPYALILVPWMAWTLGWRPLVTLALVGAAGLLIPVAWYGWDGNLMLFSEWYRTVSETTRPNLLLFENISFASMWAKWLAPGSPATVLALVSSVIAVLAGFVLTLRRRVTEPCFLEGAYFLLVIPLVSPQGWEYGLLLALPAYMVLVDRWRDLSPAWAAVAAAGFFCSSFAIFDLLGRSLYTHLMQLAVTSVGAILIGMCLIRMRWRALA